MVFYLLLFIILYLLYGNLSPTKIENFNMNAAENVSNWKFPIDGRDRRKFANKMFTGTVDYEKQTFPVQQAQFDKFAKHIQDLGNLYIKCEAKQKVNIMNDILEKLYTWANADMRISDKQLFYISGVALTLGKLQSDKDFPPRRNDLVKIYKWMQSNVINRLSSTETHAALAYFLVGILSNNEEMRKTALIIWGEIFHKIIPELFYKLQTYTDFLDIGYVLNDATLVLYTLHLNKLSVFSKEELNIYHKLINKYAEFTSKNNTFLTMLYGDKNPAHTLSWLVLYYRMFNWYHVEVENLQFFTDNLETMLTYRDVGYAGSTFWNFALL